jgi:hypothetical protein
MEKKTLSNVYCLGLRLGLGLGLGASIRIRVFFKDCI